MPMRGILRILDDEPVREDVAFHRGLHQALPKLQFLGRRRAAQFDAWLIEKLADLRGEARLVDDALLLGTVAPAVQPGDDDGFLGHIHHGTRAEGLDQLIRS